ncbi:hypothetical protein BGZ50_001392, partial [Haplosporangium sp. Z 11]
MDTTRPAGRGPSIFRIHGELYHRIGSILPAHGQQPVFAQIYFHDPSANSQTSLRLNFIRNWRRRRQQDRKVDVQEVEEQEEEQRTQSREDIVTANIVDCLQRVMDTHNPYAKQFKTVGE